MDLNYTFASIANAGNISESLLASSSLNFNNGMYKIQLVIPVKEDLEIPTFVHNNIKPFIRTSLREITPTINEVRILLFKSAYEAPKRSSDSIFLYLINSGSNRIRTVKTASGKMYHGNKSFITNADFEPLYMSVIAYKIDYTEHTLISEGNIVYISPLVFQDQSDLMNKAIIKKFILGISQLYNSKVIIKDISDWIKKDVPPPFDNNNEMLHNLLQDNLTNVLDAVA